MAAHDMTTADAIKYAWEKFHVMLSASTLGTACRRGQLPAMLRPIKLGGIRQEYHFSEYHFVRWMVERLMQATAGQLAEHGMTFDALVQMQARLDEERINNGTPA